MRKREQELYVMLRRVHHYAACLERECTRLGSTTVSDSKDTTLSESRALLDKIKDANGRR